MKREPNESFEAYKKRRAIRTLADKAHQQGTLIWPWRYGTYVKKTVGPIGSKRVNG